MASSYIITGQFVRINQAAASVGDRIIARLIDMFVLFCYIAGMSLVFFKSTEYYAVGERVYVVFFLIVILPACFYSFLCEAFANGQSIGKRLRGIRVVSIDGTAPGIGSLLLRWVLLSIDLYFYGVGLFVIMITKKHWRIGDLAAGTMVVKLHSYERIPISLAEFSYADEDYRPTYTEAQQLSADQAEVIHKALFGGKKLDHAIIEALADKVKNFLEIAPREADSAAFLTTLLHDYQHYTTVLV